MNAHIAIFNPNSYRSTIDDFMMVAFFYEPHKDAELTHDTHTYMASQLEILIILIILVN